MMTARRFNAARACALLATYASFASFAFTACAQSLPIGAKVVDVRGNPVPGALVYVEAWKHPGAYDFCFGMTDDSGRIAQGDGGPRLQWKSGARYAYAAFADGKAPFAAVEYRNGAKPGLIHIRLSDASDGPSAKVAKLGFPFPGQPDLSARAAAPDAASVRDAFWKAYGLDGMRVSPEDRPKYEALRKLMTPSPGHGP